MKKSKSIIINVPSPCHENWDKMTPAEKGRHCSSCNKTVIDFSAYTDRELVEFISKNTGSVCGRLSPYQVNRPIVSYEQNNSSLLQRIMMGTALATSMAACNENPNSSQTIPPQTTQLNTDTNKKGSNTGLGNNYISGRMVDEKSGWHIPHLAIRIEGTKYYAITDTNGNFKITVPDSIIGKKIKLEISEDSLYEIMSYSYREIEYTIDKLPFMVNIKMHCTLDERPVQGHLSSDPGPEPLTGVIVSEQYLPDDKSDTNKIYPYVEHMPKFNGDMNKYIADNIIYPDGSDVEGIVYISFVIERSGEVSNVKILRGIPGAAEFDSVAVKAVKSMPSWIPGGQDGKKLRVSMNVPIKFRLNDRQSDTTKNSSHK